MRRKDWIRLKEGIERVFDPTLMMEVHHTNYSNIRFWVTCGGETVWDYPNDFLLSTNPNHPHAIDTGCWNWIWQIPVYAQQNVIRAYLDTPCDKLLDFAHETDHWGLGGVLLAGDRRLGSKRLFMWTLMQDQDDIPGRKVLGRRFGK